MLEKIKDAIRNGRVNITNHSPFPSCLILGFDETHRPIHAVVAYSEAQRLAIVVTAYVPNLSRWIDFRIRRR